MKMTGMILAAGLGTRMKSLSQYIPKPLLPVMGKPMLSVIASKLAREGAEEIHINLHHMPRKIEDHPSLEGYNIAFHPEPVLLDTGGGIGNMASGGIYSDIILLHNSDIISDIEYGPAIADHIESGALFTMVLLPPVGSDNGLSPPPHVLVDPSTSILGFSVSAEAGESGGSPVKRYGYTGMSVISRKALSCFPAGKKYTLTGKLDELIAERPGSVKGYIAGRSPAVGDPASASWAETGNPSAYLMLHRRILTGRESFDPMLLPPPGPLIMGKGSSMDPGATWKGFLSAGQNVVIKKDTALEDCVILDDTIVPAGTSARNSIFFPGGMITGEL